MKSHLSLILLCLVLLTGCFGSSGTKNMPPRTAFVATGQASSASLEAEAMSPLELQAAVMAFADTTNARLAQAAKVIEDLGTPQARLTSARMMVFDVGSNVEIAAGPYPGIALLDMIVTTSLRRIVWEDYWVPVQFGSQADPALEVFREAEREIWELAGKVMAPDHLDELAKVILRWRKRNPKQVSVNYVRFDDFGELGLKPSMRKLTTPGGLFASVKEATMVAQDMKVSIDRAFYLMSRMQLIVNFQIKLAYLEMIFQPETNGLIDTTEQMAGITERYAEIAEHLPERVGAEAANLIGILFTNLEKNTTQMLVGINQWQDEALKETMVNISKEREAAINQTLNGLLEQQKVLFSQMDTLVDESRDDMEATLNHAFMLAVLLIVIFFAALTAYKLIIGRASRGQAGK